MTTTTTTDAATAPASTERPVHADRVPQRKMRPTAPLVDIYETDKEYVVLADMPGVTAETLEVVTENQLLIVRGHVVPPATEPTYQEFELRDYARTFLLTEDLDTGNITAALKDGVLRVEVPKSARVQPKKIPVRPE